MDFYTKPEKRKRSQLKKEKSRKNGKNTSCGTTAKH